MLLVLYNVFTLTYARRPLQFLPTYFISQVIDRDTSMLLIGICTNLTANPIKPITRNPIATAREISKNSNRSAHQTQMRFQSRLPRLLGFVHLLRKNAPSLTKSRGISRICLTCSDILAENDESCSSWQRTTWSNFHLHRGQNRGIYGFNAKFLEI